MLLLMLIPVEYKKKDVDESLMKSETLDTQYQYLKYLYMSLACNSSGSQFVLKPLHRAKASFDNRSQQIEINLLKHKRTIQIKPILG